MNDKNDETSTSAEVTPAEEGNGGRLTVGELVGLSGVQTVRLPALDSLMDQVRAVLSEVTPVEDRLAGLVKQLPVWSGLGDTLNRIAQQMEELLPSNWSGLSGRYEEVIPVMRDEGIPLAWVPPAPVVRELLDAPDAPARRAVLEKHQPAVWAACRDALDEVGRAEFAEQVLLMRDCVDMAEAGHTSGAQALAAAVWDTTVRGFVRATPSLQANRGRFAYRELLAGLPKAEDQEVVRKFRVASLFAPFERACQRFDESTPVPDTFSRHATTHATGQTQYTPVNATIAVMLAVSVLRGLEADPFTVSIHA
ncbi:hypothetical protein ACFVZ4_29955 [Streptomyces goshikiensis]|uniref:hypothetical protein n=1 Tax=Streptomyces goshikiensis TaxID=1942 RepID=UPI0036959CF5